MKKSNKKRPVGRPPMQEHEKAKPITKTLRVPLGFIGCFQLLRKAVKDGRVTVSQIEELANQKGA